MLSCKDTAILLSQDMDGELPLGKWLGLRMHMLMCGSCARIKKQLLFLKEALGRLGDGDAPVPLGDSDARLSDDVREKIRASMRE